MNSVSLSRSGLLCLVLLASVLSQIQAQTTGTLSFVHAFSPLTSGANNVDGNSPQGGLTEGPDGNLYGSAAKAGANGEGTLFKVTPQGVLTVLYNFSARDTSTGRNADGAVPAGTLLLASDGNFYGLTIAGGDAGNGTIFRFTLDGTVTTLHSFTRDEAGLASSPLIQGRDGALYGTLRESGSYGTGGTVFRITLNGTFALLHTFNLRYEGSDPQGALVQGSDGNFYGTTSAGGSVYNGPNYNYGAVFRITTDGTISYPHVFTGSDGSSPSTNLVEGRDGFFYGATAGGGDYGNGTIFQMGLDGAVTTLHSFPNLDASRTNVDGNRPIGQFVMGRDGNFYGTTSNGGSNGSGTIYQISASGELTVLHSFTKANQETYANSDGYSLFSGLSQASDGSFYGAAALGGAVGRGTVFRLTVAGESLTPVVALVVPGVYPGNSIQITEGDPKLKLKVVRINGDLSRALTIHYKAKGDNVPGVDYKALSGTVTIPTGASSAKLNISAFDDGVADGDKLLTLKIKRSSDNSYALGNPPAAKILIHDPQSE